MTAHAVGRGLGAFWRLGWNVELVAQHAHHDAEALSLRRRVATFALHAADEADAHAVRVDPRRMSAYLIQAMVRPRLASEVDHAVEIDGWQWWIECLAGCRGAIEAARRLPGVAHLGGVEKAPLTGGALMQRFATQRGAAMNSDEVDRARHARHFDARAMTAN